MSTEAIARLERAGLIVLPLGRMPGSRRSFTLFKPAGAAGNSRPGWTFELHRESGDVTCDAPCGTLEHDGGEWIFCVHEFYPEVGPGDFCQPFATLEEAADAAHDYYFGDPARMNPPELADYPVDESEE